MADRPGFLDISFPGNTSEFKLFTDIWNIGIDSRLNAFVVSKVEDENGRRTFYFAHEELHILLYRLEDIVIKLFDDDEYNEDDIPEAESWLYDIRNCIKENGILINTSDEYKPRWY